VHDQPDHDWVTLQAQLKEIRDSRRVCRRFRNRIELARARLDMNIRVLKNFMR
jgi:hypothetical protein